MHGVNLDQLGRRDQLHYGKLTFGELERQISDTAAELGLATRFFQTNHEGEFVEHLHRLEGLADGIVLNPGAWTHYSYAIRDALELTGLPAVEVHLSDVDNREQWRRHSVIRELCIDRVAGKGPDGLPRRARPAQAGALAMSDRADRLSQLLTDEGVDLMLVTDLVNVRYLTGYTGTNGLALVGSADADVRHRLPLRGAGRRGGRRRRTSAGAHPRSCSTRPSRRFRTALCGSGSRTLPCRCASTPSCRARLPDAVELVAAGSLVERLRAVKDPTEIEAMRAAAAVADEAFEQRASPTGSSAGPSGRWRSRWSGRCASVGRAARASTRSWPPAPTERCRTPSLAT